MAVEDCGRIVSWWDGEYVGGCELPSTHGGDHFDGSSWYDDEGHCTDDLHVSPPVRQDQAPYQVVRGVDEHGEVLCQQAGRPGTTTVLEHKSVVGDKWVSWRAQHTFEDTGIAVVTMERVLEVRLDVIKQGAFPSQGSLE